MKIKAKILYILLFATCFASGQNLIPNPGFEDTVHCPSFTNQLNRAKFWVNPTTTTPDYYNSCCTNPYVANMPFTAFGYQWAHNGNGIAGFYAFYKGGGTREYVQTQLTNTLTLNHKYLVSFYVNLSDGSQYSLSNIGAYFSPGPISSNTYTAFGYTPQIESNSSVQLADSVNWMLVADTLVSNGTEQYITIGNFRPDSTTDTAYVGSFGGNDLSYYYIDDVSVIDVQDLGVNEMTSISLKVLPNPASSTLNIEARLQDAEIGIYDMLGNKLRSERLNYRNQLDISQFPKGVYFLRIWNKEKTYSTKFVKE